MIYNLGVPVRWVQRRPCGGRRVTYQTANSVPQAPRLFDQCAAPLRTLHNHQHAEVDEPGLQERQRQLVLGIDPKAVIAGMRVALVKFEQWSATRISAKPDIDLAEEVVRIYSPVLSAN